MNKALLLFIGACSLLCQAGAAQQWSLHETAQGNGRRLSPIPLPAAAMPAGAVSKNVIRIEEAARLQQIEGFGGALTESSAYVLAKLPASQREQVLRSYYDPAKGIGYTLARTHINSCDFSVSSWALDETPGDVTLKDFSLAHMRRTTLPLIHQVQEICGRENFRLLASPWSPPAWMKSNGTMLNGGKLRAEYRDAWALYFVKFVESLRDQEKIAVWALTVQNEPEATQVWESCRFTGEEERDFVSQHLGPALHKAGLSQVHLLGHDHNRDILEARAKTMLGDPKAAQYFWGMSLHWYVSEDFPVSSRVQAAFPEKKLIFTEGCIEGGAKPGFWGAGERYARNIIGDFRNHVAGWIDWNIALDLKGGPNHVGNFCDAPVLVDIDKGSYSYQSSFYYIGHFSRFVRTGAHRLPSEGGDEKLQHVAFENPDGSLIVVVLNLADEEKDFTLATRTDSLFSRIPAHGIQSYVRSNR